MRVKKVNPTPDELSLSEFAAMCFIQAFPGRSPTIREVQAVIGLSLGATHELISRLVEYGYLERRCYKSGKRMKRNLRVRRMAK